MKYTTYIAMALCMVTVLFFSSVNAAEKFRPVISKELQPPEKVTESFGAVVKVQFAEEDLTGWIVAPGVVATAGHSWVTANALTNEVRAFIGDEAATVAYKIYYNRNQDLALFRIDETAGNPYQWTTPLRKEPLLPKELVWWRCESGFLKGTWSVGAYLKEMPIDDKSGYRESRHLIAALIGGNASGCSGSPVLDSNGQAVARISGSIGAFSSVMMRADIAGSQHSDAQILNIVVAGVDDMERALFEAGVVSVSNVLSSRTLPDWMAPPDAVRNKFAGVVEIEISDGAAVTHGSAWRISQDMFVTAAHFYNKLRVSDFVSASIKKNGKTYNGTLIARDADADLAFFRVQEETGLPLMRLREEPLKKDELAWWYCAAGLLTDEWSMGRFLGEVPPREALEGKYANNVYLVNTILGGVHAGCSGAPVVDYEGAVIGLVNGFMAGGSFNNIFAIRAEDIRRALEFAENRKGDKGDK